MLRFRAPGAFGAVLLWAAFLASQPAPASASIVQALDLEELVAQSDRIVIGRVVFAESYLRSDGTIATAYRFAVERQLRSDGPRAVDEPEVIVRVMGGRIGDIGMRVEGEPRFNEGERALLFIRQGQSLAFRPVGMAQGVLRIRMEQGRETVRQNREGLMLVKRAADGRLEPARGAIADHTALDSVIRQVRDIVLRQVEAKP
ncbi:MAG: hypothetical protein AAF436_18245 [Myxococcota bacterium]